MAEEEVKPIFSPDSSQSSPHRADEPTENEEILETIRRLTAQLTKFTERVKKAKDKAEDLETQVRAKATQERQRDHISDVDAAVRDNTDTTIRLDNIVEHVEADVSVRYTKTQEHSDTLAQNIEKTHAAVGDPSPPLAATSFTAHGFESAVTQDVISKIPPKTYALLDSPISTDALYATAAQLAASSNSYLVPPICNTDTLVLDLNRYPISTTADWFRGPLRFPIMDDTNASMIVDENVPPHPKSWQHHDAVRMQAQALGLHSRASYLDVSHVDTAPSRTLWIHSSSRSSLPARIDIAHLSGMSSLSKPVSDILEPTASIPSSYWINDAHVANCLIYYAFHHTQWHGTRSVDHATVHICMRTYIHPTTAIIPPHISEHIVRLSCALPSPTTLGLCQPSHSPSLRERLHYYSVPKSLLELATTSAYNTICTTLPEAQPFIERFRDQLRDAAFYGALLHLPLDLSDQGVRNASDSVELPAPSAFASCSQLLNYPLKLSFHDEVPTSNQFISPAHFAQLSHANTTTDFSQLGGSADQLQYLLSNSFVSLSLLPSDNDSQPGPG